MGISAQNILDAVMEALAEIQRDKPAGERNARLLSDSWEPHWLSITSAEGFELAREEGLVGVRLDFSRTHSMAVLLLRENLQHVWYGPMGASTVWVFPPGTPEGALMRPLQARLKWPVSS